MEILMRVVLLSAIANGGIVLGVETEPVMLTDFSVCTPRSAPMLNTTSWRSARKLL